jgi:hypothetical protein
MDKKPQSDFVKYNAPWTAWEERTLRNAVIVGGFTGAVKKMPRRTPRGIKAKMYRLGITNTIGDVVNFMDVMTELQVGRVAAYEWIVGHPEVIQRGRHRLLPRKALDKAVALQKTRLSVAPLGYVTAVEAAQRTGRDASHIRRLGRYGKIRRASYWVGFAEFFAFHLDDVIEWGRSVKPETYREYQRWTDEEMVLLGSVTTLREALRLFPNRSGESIESKFHKFKK